jgi:hypothetical protein
MTHRRRQPTMAVVLILCCTRTLKGEAHRSGCHRRHSCPSDQGTYTRGDLGYCSQCPITITARPARPK